MERLTEEQKRGLELIKLMDREMSPVFQRSVLPIFSYAPEHDHQRPLGTGALFEIAGHTFLVSASHVLRAVLPKQAGGVQADDLCVALPSTGVFAHISGQLHGDSSDAHDVGVLELTSEGAAALSSVTALTLDDIDANNRPPKPGWHYVCGWPLEWRKSTEVVSENGVKKFPAGPFIHSTGLYTGSTDGLQGFRPEHVALELDPANTGDSNGVPVATPLSLPSSLEGISGCPIWRSFLYGEPSTGWNSARAKVVAVQTAVYKVGAKTIIRGTPWDVVLSILRKKYSDIDPALRLFRTATSR